ncbi:hypothetical protein Fmac_030546 [Flemingia macrophylla]|uniref:Uncharacterized protein n=1 Tax=Flemingia macrophylla TaxID=520843 RepID=A0ABD1L0S9_9FABA
MDRYKSEFHDVWYVNSNIQKIEIEVPLHCEKCKRKIMAICTTTDGNDHS